MNELKILGYISFSGAFLYLGVDGTKLGLLAGLMAIDIIFALINSTNINSKRLREGLTGKLLVFLIILAIAVMLKSIDQDPSTYFSIVTGLFSGNEFLSITRHYYFFRTGKTIKEHDVISLFIKKINKIILNSLKYKIDEIEGKEK